MTITKDPTMLCGIKKCNVIIRNQEECIEVSYADADLVLWAQPTRDDEITVVVQLPTGAVKSFTLFSVLPGLRGELPTLLLYSGAAAIDLRAAPSIDPVTLTGFLG